MKVVPVLTAAINEQGQIKLTKAERLALDLRCSALRGKNVTLMVEEVKNTRSVGQNAFWWAVLIPLIADHLGYDRHEHEEVHYWLVATCFGTKYDERIKQHVP